MSAVFIHPLLSFAPMARGRMVSVVGAQSVGVFRQASDPLFFAPLRLLNIVPGSRYLVRRAADGLPLAMGVATEDEVLLPGVPVYASPMAVDVIVRKGSEAQKYLPFETRAYMVRQGTFAFIAQVPDRIA